MNSNSTMRNDKLVDKWSLIHVLASAALAYLLNPLLALLITTAWEPFEIFIFSPLLAKFGVVFGHESLRNSLSDLVFNALGIILAILFFGL